MLLCFLLLPPIGERERESTVVEGLVFFFIVFLVLLVVLVIIIEYHYWCPLDFGRLYSLDSSVSGSKVDTFTVTQRLQNPLIKEYTLNHIRDPIII